MPNKYILNLFKIVSKFKKLANDNEEILNARLLLNISANATRNEISQAFAGRAMPYIISQNKEELAKLNKAKELLLSLAPEEEKELQNEQSESTIERPSETSIKNLSLDKDDYLYHITFYKNLESISSDGLVPGRGQLLGHGGNAFRSFGNIFLTNASGIKHWYSKIEDMAEYQSDNLLEDQVVPIVIRTPKDDEDAEDETAEGYGYGNQSEFKRTGKIEPEDLEVWDGRKWVDIYSDIDIFQALIAHEESSESEEDSEDYFPEENNIYYTFKYLEENPLVPQM